MTMSLSLTEFPQMTKAEAYYIRRYIVCICNARTRSTAHILYAQHISHTFVNIYRQTRKDTRFIFINNTVLHIYSS